MRRSAVWLFLLILGCARDEGTHPVAPSAREGGGPVLTPDIAIEVADSASMIPNRYIVYLTDPVPDLPAIVTDLTTRRGATVHYQYRHAFRGFAATFPPGAIEAVRRDARVRRIVQDRLSIADDVQSSPPNWGLDRVDQHNRPLDNVFRYFQAGSGVRIYIIDSGIKKTHPDFGGRALHGLGWGPGLADSDDCNGHGTAVAGIAGSATYGVAKGATLYAVKINDCDNTTPESAIIGGIDWVIANHVHPAVANLSWTLSIFAYESVQALYNHGVALTKSAGNSNTDACADPNSINNLGEVFVVAASDQNDSRSTFSNFGSCVDIFAPGTGIVSTSLSGGQTAPENGTSLAAPHVAGAMALMLQEEPSLPVPNLYNRTKSLGSTLNILTNIGSGSPNALLYSIHTGVTITGPSTITETGNYTWAALPIGGDSNKSYFWEYRPVGQSNWQTVSTSSSYNRFVNVDTDPDFDLRVTHTSANDTRIAEKSVIVHGCPTFTC